MRPYLFLGRTLGSVFLLLGLTSCDQGPGNVPKNLRPTFGIITAWPLMSRLPIVVVDTSGRQIPDEPKIPARLTIIQDKAGQTNSLQSSPRDFEGKIAIELRGQTSQREPKKSYGFELRADDNSARSASLLGLPAESDWILYGPYSDKSLIRDYLAYELSNRMGRYASRSRFVEMLLNDTNAKELQPHQYIGVYLLLEKIKRGAHRVDIGKSSPNSTDPSGKNEAFIVKIDKRDPGDRGFVSSYGTRFIHVYPKMPQPNSASQSALIAYLNGFETALRSGDYANPERGYAQFIDPGSFIDYFLLNELCKNIDAYRISTFLHKRADGKLNMGPSWDFNLAMGNSDMHGATRTSGWAFDAGSDHDRYQVPFWWRRLLSDPKFRGQLATRWKSLRADAFAEARIFSLIDQATNQLNGARQSNFERWQVLGRYIRSNTFPLAGSYEEEIRRLKGWLHSRLNWMDANIEDLP